MQIFIDSHNAKDIIHWKKIGVVDGVLPHNLTQNYVPQDYQKLLSDPELESWGVFHLEVFAADVEEICSQADILFRHYPRAVIQIPMTPEGMEATRILSAQGVTVNVTLCFTLSQLVFAHKMGARFVTTCISCLHKEYDNVEIIVMDLLKLAARLNLQLIVAGVRSIADVELLASLGVERLALPPHILQEMYWSPLTDNNLAMILDSGAARNYAQSA